MTQNRSRVASQPYGEGDIVVTAVANHYAIGRVKGDGITQEPIGSQQDLADALARACELVGASHRVFLSAQTGTRLIAPVDCETIRSPK